MMTARDITAALGGKWHGRYGFVSCPLHTDKTPSLKISDGDNETVVHCFACGPEAWPEIKAALRGMGLIPDHDGAAPPPDPAELARRAADSKAAQARYDAARTAAALDIWRACGPISGTKGQAYLDGRGIAPPYPPTLRFHPQLDHGPSGRSFPAMVAAVTVWPSRSVTAIHRTYLREDGHGKADVENPKLALGPCRQGAARLADGQDGLTLCEGIEDGLSLVRASSRPVWACLGTAGLAAVAVPPVQGITIAADNNEAGLRAARLAADRLADLDPRITMPPPGAGDWNDMLLERRKAS